MGSKWMGSSPLQVVTFSLQGERCAIDADMVRDILDLVPITEVPSARPFVNGLINVRGRVVPLADLRLRLGMEQAPPTIDTRIIVIEADLGEPTAVGLLADKVHEVTEIEAAAMEEAPRLGMRWRPELIRGIGKCGGGFVIVFDIDRLLKDATPAAGSTESARQPPS